MPKTLFVDRIDRMADSSFDLKGFIGSAISGLRAAVEFAGQKMEELYKTAHEAGYQQGYQQGYQAGATAMRESILRAVQTPPALDGPSLPLETPQEAILRVFSSPLSGRAPRGAVRAFVRRQLWNGRAVTLSELHRIAEDQQEKIASSSISNELQRHKGSFYSQDPASGRWSLIPQPAEVPGLAPTAQEVRQAAE